MDSAIKFLKSLSPIDLDRASPDVKRWYNNPKEFFRDMADAGNGIPELGGILMLPAKILSEERALKSAYQIGKEGEDAVKSVYKIGDKSTIIINGRTRVPDGLTGSALSEVKNTKSISLTKQLQDYSDFAKQEGLKFYLYTRSGINPSTPLQRLIDNGLIIRRDIP